MDINSRCIGLEGRYTSYEVEGAVFVGLLERTTKEKFKGLRKNLDSLLVYSWEVLWPSDKDRTSVLRESVIESVRGQTGALSEESKEIEEQRILLKRDPKSEKAKDGRKRTKTLHSGTCKDATYLQLSKMDK